MTEFEKISDLLTRSSNLQSFLDQAVIMVADRLNAAVCSIYLYNENTGLLTLKATHGLSTEVVGEIKLRAGEGLVGKVFKESRPVCVSNASQNPDYRFFSEAGEEAYDAFLAIPISHGIDKIGVAVVQREANHRFTDKDVKTMLNLTAQFASAIETVRAMFQIEQTHTIPDKQEKEFMVPGSSASPGYALAPSVKFRRRPVERILKHNRLTDSGNGTNKDLEKALKKTAEELQHLQVALGEKLPEVASLIFESHIMMLKDHTFTGNMLKKIEEGISASRAVAEVSGKYIDMFEASTHDYMKEKARDIEDLALRILSNLSENSDSDETVWKDHILIVRELLPSDILRITLEDVAGIIQVGGGMTSHISILVRSLNIPMVIVDDISLMRIPDEEQILLDAYCGNVFVNPSEKVIKTFREREHIREIAETSKTEMVDKTLLLDKTPVTLLANINLLSELDLALDLKAEGVGLYRTEFPFLIRQTLPSEDEQFAVYTRLMQRMHNRDVTIRTLDAGGDKVLAYFDDAGEPNPALGLRSTRLTLRYREIFDHQIRAILRAGANTASNRIMFPMISSVDEFLEAKSRVTKCIAELKDEGLEMSSKPKIGMMVELPAVLEIIDDLASAADFFSIGTNDFIQYMLAADRTNDRVADYYCPHHPSVLRGLKRIADAAKRHNIQCAVCGEMAHDIRYVPFFLGIGIRRLSIDPHYLPEVQKCVMEYSTKSAEIYASLLLEKSSIREIESLLIRPTEPDPANPLKTAIST